MSIDKSTLKVGDVVNFRLLHNNGDIITDTVISIERGTIKGFHFDLTYCEILSIKKRRNTVCTQWQSLTPQEKTIMVGKLNHIIQSDSRFFEIANNLINIGEKAGLLDNVEILFHTSIKEVVDNPILVPKNG